MGGKELSFFLPLASPYAENSFKAIFCYVDGPGRGLLKTSKDNSKQLSLDKVQQHVFYLRPVSTGFNRFQDYTVCHVIVTTCPTTVRGRKGGKCVKNLSFTFA